MELKDMGLILRDYSESWMEPSTLIDGDFDPGWDAAMIFCGRNISDLLNKCNVPASEEDDDETELERSGK